MKTRIVLASSLAATALAGQPLAPAPIQAPLRELPWGQLNFLHTTDTHGWHGGHLQEASFSADWGDYISFAHHMREIADKEGWDMLLVDTGDRIEGNGLYDASEPKGKYTFDIFKQQDIDIICSGNHELYKANSSENEWNQTVPNFKGKYLASNLDFLDPKSGKFVPLAPRFRKFKTKNQGIRVTAFGFIFDFMGGANNTRVQLVEDTVKEKWFQDAIKDKDVDLFVVTGHVAVRSEEYDIIYKAIRDHQWDIPIQFFGGHTHIRDYKIYDKKSAALESGRYMETIGFMSIKGLSTPKTDVQSLKSNLEFSRRYIDNNVYSLQHHSQTNSTTFNTALGRNVTGMISLARLGMELDNKHGCAPQDYWVNRAKFQASDSIFDLLDKEVLPGYFEKHKNKNSTQPKLFLTNTGALRFDIFKGPFTKDSTYLVSPFTSGFRFIKNVDYGVASRVLEVLNNNGPILESMDPTLDLRSLVPPEQLAIRDGQIKSLDYSAHRHNPFKQSGMQKVLDEPEPAPGVVPGYTTHDDGGDEGDDTVHSPIKYYEVPNCMQTAVDFPQDPKDVKTVDLIYNEFIQPWIILALRFLGREYDREDTQLFSKHTLTDVLADWVEKNWQCDEDQ